MRTHRAFTVAAWHRGVLLLCCVWSIGSVSSASAQGVLLVDFGSSPSGNTFGLAGWNTVLASGNLSYSAAGPGGIAVASDLEEYTDFRGVRGPSRAFSRGERVVVTWFNNSDEEISFTARISFTDPDVPDGGATTGAWFTMRTVEDYRVTFCRAAPRSSCRTSFNIEREGVHKTDAVYGIVNINLAIEWGDNSRKEALLCDKIELFPDADLVPPSRPTGLSATPLASNAVVLRWNPASDNVAVGGYLLRLNGEIERFSEGASDTVAHLQPATRYACTVSAVDRNGNESAQSAAVEVTTLPFPAGRGDLVQPAAFTYLGALRLPDAANYGGEALAYSPEGDGGESGSGASDGFPGSLFTMNNIAPDAGWIGEIGLPAPKITSDIDAMNEAVLLQNFVNIRPANVQAWPFVDVWNAGLAWLPGSGGGTLYSTWSYYYQVSAEKTASVSATRAGAIATAPRQGAWFVHTSAAPLDAALNDYLFALPAGWAAANTGGRRLVTGRNREGGLSGLGPTLYAFGAPDPSAPPAPNAELPAVPLLQYGPVERSTGRFFPDAFVNYHHADWFRGAAWVEAGSASAIVLFGVKGRGDAWYGYTGEQMRHDWVIADVPYPDFAGTDPDGKGWRGHSRLPMLLFFDPRELGRVAAGSLPAHRPQPYAALRCSAPMFPRGASLLRDAAYDPVHQVFYAVEMAPEADGRVLIHAWRVEGGPAGVEAEAVRSRGALRVYPQPASEQLTIEALPARTIRAATLYDALGRTVRRWGSPGSTLDVRELPSGVYQLAVESDAGVLCRTVLLGRQPAPRQR